MVLSDGQFEGTFYGNLEGTRPVQGDHIGNSEVTEYKDSLWNKSYV